MSKMQDGNKTSTNERKIFLEAWIIIILYLAITLPIHFCVPAFSWYWLTFGLIFLIVLLGMVCYKAIIVNKMNLNAEQQKRLNRVLGIYILKLWLADFVYMTAFNHWLVPTYILGIIFIIVLFNSLVNSFLGKRNNNSFLNFCLASDLIIGVALTIYLIYIIPENMSNLRNIVTTIVAAVYGGLLTLAGVAWTIRRQDEIHKEEEIKKAKPLFTFRTVNNPDFSALGKMICFDDNEEQLPCRLTVIIENSECSTFTLERVFHDNKWFNTVINKIVLPNAQVYLDLRFENITKFILEVKDALGNFYYYELKVLSLNGKDKEGYFIHTLKELKEIKRGDVILQELIREKNEND